MNMAGKRRWIAAIAAAIAVIFAQPVRAEDPPRLASPRPFHIGGFADLELHTSSDSVREGLDLVELDLFANAQLSESWSGLIELVAQRGWKRDPSDPRRFEFDIERAYVGYSTSDAFHLEIGQTHTGIVRWNEREHRSRILQTPIDVPAIARLPQDDGAWPLRFFGVWASGQTRGPLGLTWSAGAGAGPGQTRDVISVFTPDRSPAGFVSLSSSPAAVPGLEIAVAGYAQHIPAKPDALRERDLTFSVNYVNSGTEIRAEWARMNHTSTRTSARYHAVGYYALFSKRLSGRAQRVRPYLMLDRLSVDPRELYLKDARDENAWAAGARYDVTRRFSIKGEYRSQRGPDGREELLGIQFGFAF
jgi:hypothetical protein